MNEYVINELNGMIERIDKVFDDENDSEVPIQCGAYAAQLTIIKEHMKTIISHLQANTIADSGDVFGMKSLIDTLDLFK